MRLSTPEIILLVAAAIYVLMVIDRICKCFEQCSLNKSMGNAYKNLDANILHTMLRNKKET